MFLSELGRKPINIGIARAHDRVIPASLPASIELPYNLIFPASIRAEEQSEPSPLRLKIVGAPITSVPAPGPHTSAPTIAVV